MAKQTTRRHRRVRTPTVLQMEATECGAASLGIILAYYGRHVPLEELRAECRVSRDGSNALYVKKTAEKYGLDGRGYQMTVDELRELPPPYIVFWELNHFLVVEGFWRGQVYLSDPAAGRRSIDEASFRRSYTGIVFHFEPTERFEPGGIRPSTWRSLARRLVGARAAIGHVVLAGLAVVACELVAASYHLVFVDQVLVEERTTWIRPLILAMLVTIAVRLLAGVIQLQSLRRLRLSLAMVHSARFLWRVLRLPFSFYQQRYAGDISGRVDGNSQVADLASGQLATTIVGLLMVGFYAAVLIAFDPLLAGAGLLIGSLNLAAISFASQFLSDENLKIKQVRGRLQGSLMRAIQIIETIKAGALEGETLVRLTGYQTRITNSYQLVGVASALLVALPPFLLLTTTASVLWIGGTRVMQGVLSIGSLVAIQTLMANLNRPFADLVRLGSGVQALQAELARLDDVNQFPLDPAFVPRATAYTADVPRRLSGHLKFDNVTFGYNRTIDEPIIRRLTFEVQPGSRVAIVGTSGSGKSTIGRLAAGLLRPWEGTVLYDGHPIDALPRDVLTDQVALVDDQTFLFAGTARENLTLWDDTVPDRDLTRAAIDAAIHRDLIRRRGGYQAPLAEGARNLSGGQRQRLEIARALTRNPALIVLDEATNALDPVTEALVDDNLRRRGCSCLIIAHRLSTIRDCDLILVLHQGRVVQKGTHAQLMADKYDLYRELQTIQAALDAPLVPALEADRPAAPPLALDAPRPGSNGAPHPQEADDQPSPAETALVPVAHGEGAALAWTPSVGGRVEDDETDAAGPSTLAAALEPDRELVVTAGNHPLPLDDAGAVWQVIDGKVDLYYVEPPEPGQVGGRRRHLCRVEEGGSIFAVDGVRSEEKGGLLAVGVGEARLAKFPRAALLRLSLEPHWREGVAAMIDDWIDRISRATDPGVTPPPTVWLEPGDPREVEPGQGASTRSEVLWIRHVEDGLRFFGTVDVPPCPLGSRFPVSSHAWVRIDRSCPLRPWDTETLMEDGDPWVGLKRFHRVILDAIAQSRLCDAAYREARLEGLDRRDDAMVATSLAGLAQLARPDEPVAIKTIGHDPLYEAARVVAQAQEIDLPSMPAEPGDDPLRALARAAGLRLRRVTLDGAWWARDAGPLLGFVAATGRPVAMVRTRARGYEIVDAIRGTRIPLDEAAAKTLAPAAWMFLRTLTGPRQTAADLARFGASSVRPEVRGVVLLGAAGAALGTLVPWVTATVVDEALPRADYPKLAVLCGFLIALGMAISLIQILQGFALVRIKGTLEATLLPAVWDRLLGLPTRFFGRQQSGELALRAMGLARVIEVLASTTAASLLIGTFALANVGVLFLINWRLALLAVALIAVPAAVTLLMLPALWKHQRAISAAQGQISGLLLALMGGIARLRVAGAERRAFARWSERYRQQLSLSIAFQSLADRLVIFSDVWPMLATSFVFAGIVALPANTLTTGEFLAFNLALMQGMAAVIGLAKGLLPLLNGLEQYERVRPILENPPEVGDVRGETLTLGGALRLTNVSFRYESDGPLILDNVNLQVRPGEFVAVVGPSGSGKSTLLRLLLGFETPDDGVIAYDNRELATLDVREVRRQIGVVLQDSQLQPGDIYSNIVGFSSLLSYDDAWRALELAGLADDVEAMPMGIHTVLGESGGGLSSGQRQRLMIARALARHPRLLFLDEATSALDNRSQALVSRSIHLGLQGTSRLAIAHRLSTVVEADRIYVLNEGKIVQVGRYAQLIREPGVFRDLARRQCLT